MRRAGVRELRQNASMLLDQVKAGESIEVTEHGKPVAWLVPVPADPWATAVAEGRIVPGDRALSLDDIPAEHVGDALPAGATLTGILLQQRAEDDR